MNPLSSLRSSTWVSTLFLVLAFVCQSNAAPGDVDLSFDPGSSIDGSVLSLVGQPDGKLIIAGQFTMARGVLRKNLARLNADGRGDPTFLSVTNFTIAVAAIQPDGKLLVAGQFTVTCDDWGCYYPVSVLRLHQDGSRDESFAPAVLWNQSGSMWACRSLAVQPDGKVLLVGDFHTVNGTSQDQIARLNSDGTLDDTFRPPPGLLKSLFTASLEPDGDIVIGGDYMAWGSTNYNGIARLKPNGDLDPTFQPGLALGGPSVRVSALAVQTDGRILVGGYFTNALGACILRFNSDGSLDNSFNTGTGADGEVAHLALQPDGKVIIAGGYITSVNGTARQALARLNPNGSLDTGFNSGTNVAWPAALFLQTEGKLVVGTLQITVGNQTIKRLSANGAVDDSFDAGSKLARKVSNLALLPDGKILIGGTITYGFSMPLTDMPAFVNGTNQHGRLRLFANGTWDRSFRSAPFDPPLAVFFDPQDCFTGPASCIQGASVWASLGEPDGRVIISGSTETTDGTYFQTSRPFAAYVSETGSLESVFSRATNSYVTAMIRQPDGKLVLGGNLNLYGTNTAVARLLTDGSLDSSFHPGPTADLLGSGPVSVALQPDGRLIVAGNSRVARFDEHGQREAGFLGTASGIISCVAVESSGKILLGGAFSSVHGVASRNLARIRPDGSLDILFQPGTGPDGPVFAILVQPDGNILIAGDFSTVNGVLRPFVARLLGGDSGPPLRFVSTPGKELVIAWPASASGFTLQQNADPGSSEWVNVTNVAVTVGSERRVSIAPVAGQQFFRLSGSN